eukprot:m.42850 g.42850  ORF g.42850 m.42850 type:complete len:363 (+) comp19233_c0_seq1:246-1334(+)
MLEPSSRNVLSSTASQENQPPSTSNTTHGLQASMEIGAAYRSSIPRQPLRNITLGQTSMAQQQTSRFLQPSPLGQETTRRMINHENVQPSNQNSEPFSPRPSLRHPEIARSSIWTEWQEQLNQRTDEYGPTTSSPKVTPAPVVTQQDLQQYNWMRTSTQPTARRLFTATPTPSPSLTPSSTRPRTTPRGSSTSLRSLNLGSPATSPTITSPRVRRARKPRVVKATMLQFSPEQSTSASTSSLDTARATSESNHLIKEQSDEMNGDEVHLTEFMAQVELHHRAKALRQHMKQSTPQHTHCKPDTTPPASERRGLLIQRSPRSSQLSPRQEHRRSLLLDVIAAEDISTSHSASGPTSTSTSVST